MPDRIYPDILFETPKESTQQHTSVPQSNFTLQRLIDRYKRYWIDPNPRPVRKPKKLLITDFTAAEWSERKTQRVIASFEQLLADGFTLYVWQNGRYELLTRETLFYLRNFTFRINMTQVPEYKYKETALKQISRVGPAQLHSVNFEWINYLIGDSSAPSSSEPLTVYESSHPLCQIYSNPAEVTLILDQIPITNPRILESNPPFKLMESYTKLNLIQPFVTRQLIHELSLRRSVVDLNGINYDLSRMHNLQELVISTEQISRYPSFFSDTSLESLSITFNSPSFQMPFNVNTQNLRVLRCTGSSDYICPVEFFTQYLKDAQKLQSFIWTGVTFPNSALLPIPSLNFPNLRYVDLPLHISQNSIAKLLSKSEQLESLTCVPLRHPTIAQLSLSELKELNYSDRKDTSIKLFYSDFYFLLEITTQLVHLSVDVAGQNEHLLPLANIALPNLKKCIFKKPINGKVVSNILKKCKQLEHIEIVSWDDDQPLDELYFILMNNPNLRVFSLPKKTNFFPIEILLNCHRLQQLQFQCHLNEAFTAETGFPSLPELEYLNIANPSLESFIAITAESQDLQELVLENVVWLNSAFHISDFPKLTKVSFNQDCKITENDLATLLRYAEQVTVSPSTLLSHICSVPLPKLKQIQLGNPGQYSHQQLEKLLTNIPDYATINAYFSLQAFQSVAHQALKTRLEARGAAFQDNRPLHERFPYPNPPASTVEEPTLYPRPRENGGDARGLLEHRPRTMNSSASSSSGGNRQADTTPNRANDSVFMDANTSADHIPDFHVTRVFFPVHLGQSCPQAANMRLDVYQDLDVNSEPCDITHAFTIKKVGDPKIEPHAHAIQYSQNENLFVFSQQQQRRSDQASYYAKKTFVLDREWQSMPSLSAQDVLTHVHADPDVEVQYSKRDNLYYIRATTRKACDIEWLISVPTARPIALPADIIEHIKRYQNFGKGSLSITTPNPTGYDYLACLEDQAKGACRHRSCAFKVFMTEYCRQYHPDIQIRMITNSCHMFVEVLYQGQWVSCDLGGYPANLIMDETNSPQLDHPSESRERMCPEAPAVEEQPNIGANTETVSTTRSELHDASVAPPDRIELEERDHIEFAEDHVPEGVQDANQIAMEAVELQQAEDILSEFIEELTAEIATETYYQNRLQTWLKTTESTSFIADYFERLSLQGKNHLVELDSTQAVNTLSLSLEQYWRAQGRPVYYIDSPDDIRCSGPFLATVGQNAAGEPIGQLKRGPGGPLHDFLTAHQEGAPILIVNYAAFEADDIVRLNSLLDKKRRADSTAVPAQATVVGLLNVNNPDCYQGSDFYSRFHRVSDCPFSTDALQAPMPSMVRSVEAPPIENNIDLFHGQDWESKLVGRWVLNRGQFHFEKGELVQALERNERQITIQHGLWHDPKFVRFWQSLAVNKCLEFAGQSIAVPEDFVCLKATNETYDWSQLSQAVHRIEHQAIQPHAHILNPSLLTKFFGQYHCDNELESLYLTPGIIQTEKDSGHITVQVTRALSEDNWAQLLTACAKNDVKLHVDCPPSIALPWENKAVQEPEYSDFEAVSLVDLKTAVVASTDIDSTVAVLKQSSSPWVVLDASEYESADLLTRIDHKFDKNALSFKFKQRDAALLTLLARGEHVILKGPFSPELLDHLSQLIHQRFTEVVVRGRLVVIQDTKAEPMALPTLTHTVTVAKKLELLNLPAHQRQITHAQLQNDSLNRLKTRLSQDNPWQGMEGLTPDSAPRRAPDLANSHAIAQRFDKKRLKDVNTRLKDHPYVFLTGLTSVGKTTFVEKMMTGKQGKLYRGEKSLKRWALSQSRRRKILFIDEANFQEWGQLDGLMNDPAGIVIDGTYYPLTKDHKIIFAGNPVSYGDERKLAKLFHTHGNGLIFKPMPPEYIFERIIKPVFPEALLELAPTMTAPWLAVYDFLCERSQQDVLISARELQMMALLTLSYHECHPEVPIEKVAAYYAFHIAKHLVPPLHQRSFLHTFPEPDALPPLDFRDPAAPETDFLLTPSRQSLANQLSELLALRSYRRSDLAVEDAQRYGGLGGIVIEGESGIGKSELVTAWLKQCGFTETHYSAPMQLTENRFYRLSVDMDMAQKVQLLHQAFHEGSVVVIDEINSSPMMERLLNSLLMGQTLKGERPQRPGFMIIGTQNPITLAGRRAPSNALSRRFMTVTLPPYPRHEMIDIIARKIGLSRSRRLIAAYEKERAYALENHLQPIPTFRDVIKIADEEAGIVYNVEPPLDEFDTDLDLEDANTDCESVVSDVSEQDWSDLEDDADSVVAEEEEQAFAAPPLNHANVGLHAQDGGQAVERLLQLPDNQPVIENVLLQQEPLGLNHRPVSTPLVGGPANTRPNWSFYLLWLGAVVFAILAMLAFCLACNVGIAPAFAFGPFAVKLGAAIFMQVSPLYLSLCYGSVGLSSTLISISFFNRTQTTPPVVPNETGLPPPRA